MPPVESAAQPRVLAAVEDLFFVGKIQELVKQAGMIADFTSTAEKISELAARRPALILVDLNARSFQPLTLVSALKKDPELSSIPVVGFISHVQTDLKSEAQQAGCDWVIARSSLSHNLPEILRKCLAGRRE